MDSPTSSDLRAGPAPYVTIELAAAITGYSQLAIRKKIEGGIWVERREYVKAPDGRILISIKGYEAWAKSGRRPRQRTQATMRSTSAESI